MVVLVTSVGELLFLGSCKTGLEAAQADRDAGKAGCPSFLSSVNNLFYANHP